MDHEKIEQIGFSGRKSLLENIWRFHIYSPMLYRSNLIMHTTRVRWIVKELSTYALREFPKFDSDKAEMLALVHDDAEILTGDHQLSQKLLMTQEQLKNLDNEEVEAIEKLGSRWPSCIDNYVYKELLYHSLHKDCIEARLVSFADKHDALGESIHEIYAGNALFYHGRDGLMPPVKGTIQQAMFDRYQSLAKLKKYEHPLFNNLIKPDIETILKQGKPHSSYSIRIPSDLPHYDFWRNTILKHGGDEGNDWLTQMRPDKIINYKV